MELRHLRYFCIVAEEGNFTRASEVLHLTQPALSRQVKDLETEMAVSLFERGPNSLRLTKAGEIFYEESLDVIARVNRAVQRVRGEISGEKLRIGYAPSLTAGIISRALESFRAARPRVRLELAELADVVMIKQLSEGALDIGMTALGAGAKSRGIQWTEFGRVSMVAVMSATHRLAKLKRIDPARLAQEPLIAYDRMFYPEYHRIVRADLKPFGVTPRFVGEADGLSSIFTALLSQLAIAVLPGEVNKLIPPTLVTRSFSPRLPETVLGAGIPSTGNKADAELFLQQLQASARQAD
jgi:DNA-binding transcriptional LysR family regulator